MSARRFRRGSNAVEFALTLPFMVAVVSGTIDYGFYLTQQMALTEAAREGARAGSMAYGQSTPAQLAEAETSPTAVATDRVYEVLTSYGLENSALASATKTVYSGRDVLEVEVSMTFTQPFGFLSLPSTGSAKFVVPATQPPGGT